MKVQRQLLNKILKRWVWKLNLENSVWKLSFLCHLPDIKIVWINPWYYLPKKSVFFSQQCILIVALAVCFGVFLHFFGFCTLLCTVFKACVCYFFDKFLFFTKWQPFKNYEKRFLFNLKSSFRFEIFKFLYFRLSLFFSLSAIALELDPRWILKVYDAINCLHKNLITHFVWYLGKEEIYDTETLSIDRILNEEHV